MTLKVVLDTNIVVSALLKPQALEDQVLRPVLSGQSQLYVSPAVLAEYSVVLVRPKFKLTDSEIKRTINELRGTSLMVHPTRAVTASKHEPDNRFLECAEAAKADYLVTGNAKHFPKQWKATKIVNSRQFLAVLGAL